MYRYYHSWTLRRSVYTAELLTDTCFRVNLIPRNHIFSFTLPLLSSYHVKVSRSSIQFSTSSSPTFPSSSLILPSSSLIPDSRPLNDETWRGELPSCKLEVETHSWHKLNMGWREKKEEMEEKEEKEEKRFREDKKRPTSDSIQACEQ